MKDVTMISEKTPKYRRPVEKNEYSITCAIRKTPLVLTKTKKVHRRKTDKEQHYPAAENNIRSACHPQVGKERILGQGRKLD